VTAIASTERAVAVGRSFPAPDLDSRLIAYDLDTGRADEAFNARAAAAVAGNVTSITVAKDGKVYVTGGRGYVADDPETDTRPLVRLKRNGTLDRSFRLDEKLSGRSGFESFEARDGGVYFSYYPSVEPHDTRAGLVRLRANGTLDDSFPRPRFPNEVRAYAYHAPTGVVFADPGGGPWKLGPDGKKLPFAMPRLKGPAGWIAVAGTHLYLQSLSLSFNDGGMGRVDLNGVPDDSYKKRAAVALGDLPVCRATFDDSGRAYVTMVHSGSLFRLNADGTRDSTFPSFDSHIQGNCEATATPLPNGEVLLTGRYLVDDQRYSLLHLDASGQVKQRLFPVD
jgi:outer membrane protein assembly factor BamB